MEEGTRSEDRSSSLDDHHNAPPDHRSAPPDHEHKAPQTKGKFLHVMSNANLWIIRAGLEKDEVSIESVHKHGVAVMERNELRPIKNKALLKRPFATQ